MSIKGINTHKQYQINHKINENNIIERRCSTCHEWKEENINNFYMKNKSKPELGFTPECKKCRINQVSKYEKDHAEERSKYNKNLYNEDPEYFHRKSKKWYKNNTEYSLQLTSEWQKTHPQELYLYGKKHQNHRISKQEWLDNKRYFGDACAYCGMTEEKHRKLYNQDLHKDHGIDGGRNDLKNCIPSCRVCNSEKHETSINMWYNPSNPKFSQERYHKIYLWYRYDCKKFILARDVKVRNKLKKKFNVA